MKPATGTAIGTIRSGDSEPQSPHAPWTPGPWCVEDPMDLELTIVEAGKPTHEWRFIASCSFPDEDANEGFAAGEVEANARLIACAPDLAEAAEPFATIAQQTSPALGDDTEVLVSIGGRAVYTLALGSFRAARMALRKATAG